MMRPLSATVTPSQALNGTLAPVAVVPLLLVGMPGPSEASLPFESCSVAATNVSDATEAFSAIVTAAVAAALLGAAAAASALQLTSKQVSRFPRPVRLKQAPREVCKCKLAPRCANATTRRQ